jgi:hypothetical protein
MYTDRELTRIQINALNASARIRGSDFDISFILEDTIPNLVEEIRQYREIIRTMQDAIREVPL